MPRERRVASSRPRARRGEEKVRGKHRQGQFAEGLELSSPDEEFKLTFHNLTQAEYRGFPTASRDCCTPQFFIPRQRWYFTGRVTRNVEFYTVINRGYGPLDIARCLHQLPHRRTFPHCAGRMKTPYLYEYYSIAEGDLIAPERSIYAGNFATNRQMGVMALGELYQGRLGYATGIYNGPRRSFQDTTPQRLSSVTSIPDRSSSRKASKPSITANRRVILRRLPERSHRAHRRSGPPTTKPLLAGGRQRSPPPSCR